jgi:hypothetical protein
MFRIEKDYAAEIPKYAIFEDKNQISDWFDCIYADLFMQHKSNYYIAEYENKQAIFDINKNRISGWFDYICGTGLVDRKSDFYIVRNKDKYTVFYKHKNQICEWFDKIYYHIDDDDFYFIIKHNNQFRIMNEFGKFICKWQNKIDFIEVITIIEKNKKNLKYIMQANLRIWMSLNYFITLFIR